MEHLPHIEDPACVLPRIQFLGHVIAYDCCGFYGFPDRQGWMVHAPRDPKRPDRHVREGPQNVDPALQTPANLAAFVQAWLYFGVLDEVFNVILGLNVSLDDFKESNDRGVFLTTSQLRRHIKAWQYQQELVDAKHYSGQEFMEESYFAKFHSQLGKVLVEVRDFFHKFCPRETSAWARGLTIDLEMAIFILVETLQAAGSYLWHEWQPGVGQGPLTIVGFQEPREISQDRHGFYRAKANMNMLPLESVFLHPSRDLFRDKFAELGWCPSDYVMLRKVLNKDTTGLFIASRLRRHFSSTELSHGSCTANRCLANQIDAGTYQRKHTTECADPAACRDIEIDSDSAARQIEHDHLPLVSINRAPFQQWENDYRSKWSDYKIELYAPVEVKWEETENYIAISHVWSHGLGNPNSNALPECQLRRLKQVAEEVQLRVGLTEQPAIWIDTLCIPVSQAHRDMRKKAIGTISDVFRKARQVVVLDADLQQTSTFINQTELCTRILLSGWMRRLWTLNEAVISSDSSNCQRLLIMFARGPERFNAVFEKGLDAIYYSNAAVKSLIRSLPQKSESVEILTDLTQALEFRSTSWSEDEPICLASLVGLDVKHIVKYNTAPERMFAWYSMLSTVPLEFVFHDTETLNIPGKRWAPRSLLTYTRSGALNLRQIRTKTVAIHARGVMLDEITAYFIQDIRAKTGLTRLEYSGKDPQQPDRIVSLFLHRFTLAESAHKKLELELLNIQRPAVLQNPFWPPDVILVSVTGEEGGVIYCEYVRRLAISRQVVDSAFDPLAKVMEMFGLITLTQVSGDMKWCLS